MTGIRTRAVAAAAAKDCELPIDHLQQTLRLNPGLVLGKADDGLADINYPVLTLLASGKANPQEKTEAVRIRENEGFGDEETGMIARCAEILSNLNDSQLCRQNHGIGLAHGNHRSVAV